MNIHCSDENLQTYLAQWTPWQQYQRQQEVPMFHQLTEEIVPLIGECCLTYQKSSQMVALSKDTHLDYESLVKNFVESGMNPFENTPLDWSNVRRLKEESSPLPKKLHNPMR